jgi:tetrahydromethanopterin S-methyltransferase subunit C
MSFDPRQELPEAVEAPPTGEEVHLPGPTAVPALMALGITTALIGVTTTWFLSIAGGILAVVCLVRWIRDVRRDVEDLPLEH